MGVRVREDLLLEQSLMDALDLADLASLGVDDARGELPHFWMLGAALRQCRHLDRGLVVRDHRLEEGAVRVGAPS